MASAGAPVGAASVNVDQEGLLMRDTVARFFLDMEVGTPLTEGELYGFGFGDPAVAAAALQRKSHQQRRLEELRRRYVPQVKRVLDEPGWSTVIVEWGDFVEFDEAASIALAKSYVRYESYVNEGLTLALTQINAQALVDKGRRSLLTVAFTKVLNNYTVRTLRSSSVGELCALSGTVTRTSQVRPELLVGVFKCNDCGTDSEPIEQQFRYTEPPSCRNEECECKNRFGLNSEHPMTRFGDWQKIRIQENANQIPVGCMPRTLEIIARNDAVEVAKPGDRVVVTGFAVAVPEVAKLFNALNRREVQRNLSGVQRAMMEDNQGQNLDGATGLKALGVRDLNYRLCFCATTIADMNGDERKMLEAVREHTDVNEARSEVKLTPFELNRVHQMRAVAGGNILQHMARCVAPNIFKHELVKAGLLLQLLGGVPKTTMERIQLRGDINCCIVGDPSTAKSQFLKWIAHNVPRGIYTSGKASTASGLTATVTKDADTGERTIEAGALMLSDNGVCCIDEFDQMDTRDQVAIHEAMEQQTISIAKAGIKATLNARTSLLAALNPLGGKYDRRKPLAKNIAMSAPIMSRFDLMFVIVDEANDESDRFLAQRVLSLHRQGESATHESIFSIEDWALYMKHARSLSPRLTPEAGEKIAKAYVDMRVQDSLSNRNKVYRVTTRLLESIIRLSEATAKLYLSDIVDDFHVNIALDLMRQSLTTLDMTQIELAFAEETEEVKAEPTIAAPAAAEVAPREPSTESERKRAPKKKQRLEPEARPVVESQAPAGGGAAAGVGQPQPPAAQQQPPAAPKKKLTITSDQFHRMVNKFTTRVYLLREHPPTTEDLMKWYLSEIPTTDMAQLQQELHVAQLVLRKLLSEQTLIEEADEEGVKRLLLDPNYDPDTTGH